MPGNNLKYADDFAPDYDNTVLNNNWNGPELLFNTTKDLLKPKSEILDIGIGTGESSKRFQQAGHIITGLDGSNNMLEQCQQKKIGSAYILHDIEKFPFPIKNKNFDAVISNGVFHLIFPLLPVISELKRILKPTGIFAFTYENTEEQSESSEIQPGIWERKTESGVLTYKYSEELISEYLHINNLKILGQTRFLAFTNRQVQKDIYFNAIVAQPQQV
ncbi:class I SAM-dependent methyltransferase [Draconibacterium sp.]|nr:class I SAM-dependent methyltransferase [Draconibacterium sp.]